MKQYKHNGHDDDTLLNRGMCHPMW